MPAARPINNLAELPVTALRGVGEKFAQTLAKLHIATVQDLLFHLPLRYQDRTRVTPIAALAPGVDAVIEGEVRAADVVFGRRRSLMVKLQDGSGTISLRYFHFTAAQKNRFARGVRLRCYGEARRGAAGLELYHPETEIIGAESPDRPDTLTPIYPLTEGVTQLRLRGLIQQALTMLEQAGVAELLPAELLPAPLRYPLRQALQYLHAPPAGADLAQLAEGIHPAQQRLALEELLAHHLSLLELRRENAEVSAPPLPANAALERDFLSRLPFTLTGAQQRVCAEIARDLSQNRPMMRLLQGDVGAGKTLVAAMAALKAIGAGAQVAVMAPTEILAEQHRRNFDAWLAPLNIRVAQLTGSLKAAERRTQLAAIASGEAQLVVGTHALFQPEVVFHNLALVIIDEQHRFGVRQRLELREKGAAKGVSGRLQPHQLIMTATPIPRTLAMSAFADLDCSVIDELPPGRQPINTVAISNERRDQVVERVRAAVAEGRQAYWVCTLIEESESLQAQAAESTASELSEALDGVRVALVHGRLKPEQKERVMGAFKAGEVDLLVATTVIEVGVDVPNASLMIIENPERLGLAQLHQLRGRVGRGSIASHCVLLYGPPLSQNGRARLQALRQHSDGFAIAEEDLRLRGPGEILGTRQTGEIQHRIADLQRDAHLLPQVQRIAASPLLTEDLRRLLIQRWLQNKPRFAEA
ncbi:ATP-dependent DNA helicase RecG [Microbulbifer thermotolerans]|uniref:ATP-dependent DNA helicase RecG n=1 Tax=Microbulbifer thermotolerans TaxID=252514 RepID=A0AB35HZI0_MICTH|nr:ATP-dependent DNA helicase RecG [Microbulbifer thermotolerans]MCX2778606.1 ATP-dependent DNA helicase RecG [Microbulbifer thermotolerans]MCX2794082.1 ATP-dependent DNA helicase RecG [Microbulbifer thermotolerans]MCX2802977.1 ATP-dependent DNA helicase RecG [Microbulbifer thermotolerans]MCX2803885.1 ATP-dependent DNA helicase RecG [Microbulbifer thermotolerans]MCX2830720.1 ATP-dependent DNA helicase RecG [Microbulbifer thermotolerans]